MTTQTATASADCGAGGEASAANGIFVPRNGGLEGRLGKAHIFIESAAGGVLRLVESVGPGLRTLARVEQVFSLKLPGEAAPREVRQGHDRSPVVECLEEGHERMGVRARFALYDRDDAYRGHGMVEAWAYPEGDVFVTSAASFEGLEPAHAEGASVVRVSKVTGVSWAAVPTDPAARTCLVAGHVHIDGTGPARPCGAVPFDDGHLPARSVELDGGVAIWWRTGTMAYDDYVYRKEGGSPTYYQWPTFLRQAYRGQGVRQVVLEGGGARLDWIDGKSAPGPDPEFVAMFRLAAGLDARAAATRGDAERTPLALGVEGGEVLGNLGGYNDLEGVYHVRKTADPLRITVPGTAAGPVRLKVVGLSGHGSVAATLDGSPVALQLSAEGGIADDPLAPIREGPEGPADVAVVTVPVTGADRVLVLREAPGVQLVYQRRDPWRNINLFSSRNDRRHASFRFSLRDGVLRNMRAHGRQDWALTENLMHWFAYCGYTPQQMLNRMVDFQITANGPEEAGFRCVSTNAGGGARSEFDVRIPHSPSMRLDVQARFTVVENWPWANVQFFDVFPFRGVWPSDWWYDEVLWVAPDGRSKWLDVRTRQFGGDRTLETAAGPLFVALHASDRGNMVMLTHRFEPVMPVSYVICSNYIDFHMTVQFRDQAGNPAPPRPGDSVSMEYQLALWGDGSVTREQLIELGLDSLRRDRLSIGDG